MNVITDQAPSTNEIQYIPNTNVKFPFHQDATYYKFCQQLIFTYPGFVTAHTSFVTPLILLLQLLSIVVDFFKETRLLPGHVI